MGLSYNHELNYGNLHFPFCRIVPLKIILWTMAYFLVPVLDSKYCGLAAGRSQISTTCISKKSKDPYLALCSHILKSCVCVSDLKIIETRGAKPELFFQDVLTSTASKSIEGNGMETVCSARYWQCAERLDGVDVRGATLAFPKIFIFVFHYVFGTKISTQVHAFLAKHHADSVW